MHTYKTIGSFPFNDEITKFGKPLQMSRGKILRLYDDSFGNKSALDLYKYLCISQMNTKGKNS